MQFINDVPKLKGVATKDATRPTLQDAHLDAEKGELQATNTFVAVRIPVELEKGDTTGPVAISDLEAARKGKAPSLKIGKRPKPKKGEAAVVYPNLPQLWPEGEAAFRVGINVDYLKAAAEAVGAKSGVVELVFPKHASDGWPQPERAILVRATKDFQKPREEDGEVAEALLRPIVVGELEESETDPTGLVMPVRVPEAITSAPKKRSSKGGKAATTDDEGLTPAQKAARTRKRNLEQTRGRVAQQVAAVGRGRSKPKTSGRSAGKSNGASNGHGSANALKAHETRRKIQEIAAKLQKRNAKLSEKDAVNQARAQLGLKPKA